MEEIEDSTKITIEISLTRKQWEKIGSILYYYDDEGPRGEGWQGDELLSAVSDFEAALKLHLINCA